MNARRVIILISVLGMVALTAMLGWWAGSSIESPADAAARTAPPKPSPILVPVENRVLSTNIITRGTARFGLPQPVTLVPSALKRTSSLIATLPKRNTQLNESDIALTISGRPVFVMQGSVPAYRDLVPGISGEDVRQLEEGLDRLAYDPGPVDGKFDRKTSAAVAKLYTANGVEPFGATADQLARYYVLEQAKNEAYKNLQATAAAVKAAKLAAKSVDASAAHRRKAAAADLATAHTERAMIVLDPRQTQFARDAADKKMELAWAAANKARLEGDLAIRTSLDARKLAKLDAKFARIKARRLKKELKIAKSKLGVQMPVDEILFIKSLPVRVEELVTTVGSTAAGKVMTVTDNQLVVESSFTLETALLAKPGMKVNIDEQALGVKATGTISFIASTPGTRGVDGYHIYFEVLVDDTPTKLEGYSLRLTIPIESTSGTVTAIPVSALSLAADGKSRVQVESNDGSLNYITVIPGMAADGYVEVSPIGATLEPGQLVVVGYENPENEFLQ